MWDANDLNDFDDPMTVDLGGSCTLWGCGQPVNPATGDCANGHNDLDRAGAVGF